MDQNHAPEQKENGFLNILFNIILPVFILNKGSKLLGSVPALLIALAFPFLYGGYDFFKKRKMNYVALLGLLNILITGTLAILHLSGVYMWIKEAAFPLLIGVFVFASAFSKKPFFETIFLNPQLFNIKLIWEKLHDRNQIDDFNHHIKISTILLSCSFLMSAVLNFIVAKNIFLPIPIDMAPDLQSEMLNQQIADMTSKSFLVIMVPSMIFLMFILWYLMRGIQKSTGLKNEEIMVSK